MIHPTALLLTALTAIAAADDAPTEATPAPEPKNEIPAEARAVLESADELVLYALHPHDTVTGDERTLNLQRFVALGRAKVTGDAHRDVLKEIFRGVGDWDGMMAHCFMPRHGVRATKGDTTVDVVVCFECRQVYVYVDDRRLDTIGISNGVEPAVSKLFEAAGLEIDGRPKARSERTKTENTRAAKKRG